MRPHGHCDGAQRLGQECAVHVILERGRRHLCQVVARAFRLKQFLECGPVDALRHAVHNLHCVLGHQDGGHLSHFHLRPNHVLAAAPPHAVLAANPHCAVGRGRVDKQHLNGSLGTAVGGEGLHLCAGVGEVRRAHGRYAPAAQVLANLDAQFIVDLRFCGLACCRRCFIHRVGLRYSMLVMICGAGWPRVAGLLPDVRQAVSSSGRSAGRSMVRSSSLRRALPRRSLAANCSRMRSVSSTCT